MAELFSSKEFRLLSQWSAILYIIIPEITADKHVLRWEILTYFAMPVCYKL